MKRAVLFNIIESNHPKTNRLLFQLLSKLKNEEDIAFNFSDGYVTSSDIYDTIINFNLKDSDHYEFICRHNHTVLEETIGSLLGYNFLSEFDKFPKCDSKQRAFNTNPNTIQIPNTFIIKYDVNDEGAHKLINVLIYVMARIEELSYTVLQNDFTASINQEFKNLK